MNLKTYIKRLFAYILFLLITLNSVDAQDKCLFDILDDELVEANADELFNFFEENAELARNSWSIIYKSDNKDLSRLEVSSLEYLSDHLTSTGKSADELIDEIKAAGGFSSWKNHGVTVLGDMSGLDEVSISNLQQIIGSNGVSGKNEVKQYADKFAKSGYNVDSDAPINVIKLDNGEEIISDIESHYRALGMSDAGGKTVPVKYMTYEDLLAVRPSSKRQRIERELYRTLKIGQQTGSYKGDWLPKMDWEDEIELFEKIPNEVDEFLKSEFPGIARVVPLRSIDEIIDYVKYPEAKKLELKKDLTSSEERAKLFGNHPELLDSWDILYDVEISTAFRQNVENLNEMQAYIKKVKDNNTFISSKSLNLFVKNVLDKDAYMRSILFSDELYGGIKVSDHSISNIKNINEKVTSPQYSGTGKLGTYEIRISNGRIEKYVGGDKGNGTWKGLNGNDIDDVNFVITTDGKLRIGHGHYNLSGEAEYVVSAGKMQIVDGKVTELSNYSGHYLPSNENVVKVQEVFKDLGVTSTDFKVLKNPNAVDFDSTIEELIDNIVSAAKDIDQTALRTDLEASDALVKLFTEKPELVDSWKILHDMGGTNSEMVRTNAKNLENISNHLNKGVHSKDDISTGLSKTTDKQKWLDNLGNGVYRNGDKTEYVNPSGNVLSWTEQHPNSLNIQGSLTSAGETVTTGKQVEAIVADFIQKEGKEIQGFGLGVHNKTTNNTAGDIDVLTQNEIIEVKKSYSSFKKGQVDKFTDTSLPNYLNPNGRKAILYVHEPLTDLQKSSILEKIPNDVTLINSLNELKSILQ